MGTSYFTDGRSKQSAIDSLIRVTESEKFIHKTLKHSVRGNQVWTVEEATNKATGKTSVIIGLYLMSKYDGNWGYKALCEEVFPYYYNCPLSYLKMVPMKSQAWRNGVISFHNEKKNAPKLTVGSVYKLKSVEESWMGLPLEITSVKPLRGNINGQQVKFMRKMIGEKIK